MGIVGSTFVKTVGAMKKPLPLAFLCGWPPVKSVAPEVFPLSMYARMRSYWVFVTCGPWNVSAAKGSPILEIFSTLLWNSFTKES